MKIINVKQGSPEWLALRAGRITGSRMADVLAIKPEKRKLCVVDPTKAKDDPAYIVKEMRRGKGLEKRTAEAEKAGYAVEDVVIEPAQAMAPRLNYTLQLAWERMAKKPQITIQSKEMQWGRDCEEYARFCYEARTGIRVQKAGFCLLEAGFVGISPDGLVRDDGGLEIKSPFNGRIHLDTLLHGMPDEHMAQVQGCMWVTGRTWWDFISFDPRLDKKDRLFIQTIYRNEEYIARLAQECNAVNELADEAAGVAIRKDTTYSSKARDYEALPIQAPEPVVPEVKQPEHRI